MGVADNKTYKNDYIFTDNRLNSSEDNPSINDEPKINSTIKENPYRANVEIEGKEVVLQDDLSALFKAVGKRHSKGGMDVLLKPDAFVFSDFDKLKITPEEHKLFELKEGGTPAQTLKKNVDPKHYNTLTNILSDPNKDDLAKKTAMRMVDKYLKTLGNIAFIQESKKGFPQGVPQFAQGTAPVYNDDLNDKIDSNKQYAKAGGTILPKMQYGAYNAYNTLQPEMYKTDTKGQQWVWDVQTKSYHKIKTLEGVTVRSDKGSSNSQIPPFIDYSKPVEGIKGPPVSTQGNEIFYKDLSENITKDNIETEKVKVDPQGSISADWEFTPWQKLSQLYNWGQYANVKRYMPMRSRFDATYVDPALLNPEQQIGDMKGIANQQISSLGTLNPILRNAQAAGTTGELLNQIAQVRSQYDNQNSQILNQTRQYNNQIKNQETQTNMINDQQYYRESIEGRKNFDNMKQFTANNAFNNTLRDVETNQKLAYNLLTQNDPAWKMDWKTGRFNRTNKSIMDAQGNIKNDYLTELIGKQYKDWNKMDIDQRNTFIKLILTKGFMPGTQAEVPNFFGDVPKKKGGRVGKNPYKNNNRY